MKCDWCGNEFQTDDEYERYCSDECWRKDADKGMEELKQVILKRLRER